MKIVVSIVLISMLHCQQTKDWLNDWQKKQLEKRYGKVNKREKIPDWQKEIVKYEKVIDEKIKAGINAAKVYRKLGEAYAEFDMFSLCEKNLNEAIRLGSYTDKVFFQLGLCQGNQASSLNWPKEKTNQAIETFLRVLKSNPKFDKAKYQLAILYFYGLAKQSRYSILSDVVTVSQKKIRKKAILIMKEYQLVQPEDKRSYFALAGFYAHSGLKFEAANQMKTLMALFQRLYPNKYQSDPSYIQAAQNYKLLTTSKRK